VRGAGESVAARAACIALRGTVDERMNPNAVLDQKRVAALVAQARDCARRARHPA
jgi:hypothetical protein